MTLHSRSNSARLWGAVAAIAMLGACSEPLDFDLRGQMGAFNTSEAARNKTTERPKPDDRGIISYPNYQVAVARRGDTVTDVANRIGLPAEQLAKFNGLSPTVPLRSGEVIALPSRVAEPSAATGAVDIATLAGDAINAAPDTTPVQTSRLQPATKPAPTPAAPSATAPEPVRHKVARGETAYTISRLYQVPVKSLAEWNGLGSDFAIREGQYLLIPVTGAAAPKRATEVAAASVDVTEPGVGSPTPTPPSAAKPLPDEKIDPTPPDPPKTSVGKPSLASNAAMAMPVAGKIIRTYSKGRNDGIDISAAPGTAITAAADGSVAAITQDADQVPIVVVRHPNNLLTVYANVDQITVGKGDKIKRGQKLAQLRGGKNAYVHFEVRNGFDSVDPMPYLE
ncbi:peptidoglycan DD-metalloendopeptidase family protein [Rhodobacteraceae bacterium F11138]|nr:peptidoglycan DD-metalloendopeptidase family protein [Rhodobacteraceae bacterium F11138]